MYTNSTEVDEVRVKRLSQICQATGAKIVLSSSWRTLPDELDETDMWIWDNFIAVLHKYGMELYDRTPIIGMDRPLEIRVWLDKHKDQIDSFVSLDDDYSKEHYDKYDIGHCLVKTCFYCGEPKGGGLQDEHIHKAINILNTR